MTTNRWLFGAAGAAVLLALALVSHRQVGFWNDHITLWTHTLAVTNNNWVAENNLGTALLKMSRLEEAIPHFRAAAALDPTDPNSTLNIGTIHGGRAPNVVADEAKAEVLIRLVGDSSQTKQALATAAEGRAELREVLEIPAIRLNPLDGIPTTVVAFTTDIPALSGQWGEPFLIGPGSIHSAHTNDERVAKAQLSEAVEIYIRMVKELCKRASK